MPPLLLDAHLAQALADALLRQGGDAGHIATWQAGRWRRAADEVLLTTTVAEGRVLVSLDTAPLPALARRWGEADKSHASLLVLSSRINQRDIDGQLAAILAALDETTGQQWEGAVVYAHRRR